MDGSDSSLWFKINEEKGGEVVYFKRRNGRLWKLGDGTFRAGASFTSSTASCAATTSRSSSCTITSRLFLDRWHGCRRRPSAAITRRAV